MIFADGFESGDASAWNTVVGGAAAITVPGGLDRGFDGSQGQWIWVKDQVYRGGAMLAAVEPGGEVTHFAVDHLGTPRLFTDSGGSYQDVANYWGYGDNLGDDEPVDEEQKFTGHERDDHGNDNAADDLDYMHARYYGTHLCRFLSVDPARSADPKVPQSWNRYAYAQGNPLKFVDPDGRTVESALNQIQRHRREIFAAAAATEGRVTALEVARVVFQENRNDGNLIRDRDGTSRLSPFGGGPELKNAIGEFQFIMSGTNRSLGIGEMKTGTAARILGLDLGSLAKADRQELVRVLTNPGTALNLVAAELADIKSARGGAISGPLLMSAYNTGNRNQSSVTIVGARSSRHLVAIMGALGIGLSDLVEDPPGAGGNP